MNDEIIVKVARVGAATIDVCLNGSRTVEDAIAAAKISPKASESYKVNGENVDGDYELEHGDTVVLTKNIFGGR